MPSYTCPWCYMLIHRSKRVAIFTGHHGRFGTRPSPRHDTICVGKFDEWTRVAASVVARETESVVQPAASFEPRYGIVMSNRRAR